MSSVLAFPSSVSESNVIPFKVIKNNDKPIRYNKDGSISKIRNNRVAGKSTEVFFLTPDEYNRLEEVFVNKVKSATSEFTKKIANRDLFLLRLGVQVGLRISDLSKIKWSFFFDDNEYQRTKELVFKEYETLMPEKTKRHKKFVTIQFNSSVKTLVEEYIKLYPIEILDDYIFKSRKGSDPIEERSIWRILNDAAYDARLKRNIGTHTLRKTFGYNIWHNSKDKEKALITLQGIFNHRSVADTMRYIGITFEDESEVFELIGKVFDYSDMNERI